eukprot:1574042-Rhodomonas_salina.1
MIPAQNSSTVPASGVGRGQLATRVTCSCLSHRAGTSKSGSQGEGASGSAILLRRAARDTRTHNLAASRRRP